MARRTSAIWQYFNEVNEDKVSNWVCVICKTVGSCKNTSNLWKHLEVNHKAIYDEIKARKQPAKKRRREDDESSRLLDNDERMGEDLPHNNDNPSVAAAANNAGPSGASSATAANNADPSGASSASAANADGDHTTGYYHNNKNFYEYKL